MSKHSSEDRPPAYDSQIFLPSEIKHDNYYKNAMSISIIYLKTACLLFLFSGFMLWFSIYTTWQFLHITNNAMVKNQCYKYITNATGILIKNPRGKFIANNSEIVIKKFFGST
jgi:hypothetical protein